MKDSMLKKYKPNQGRLLISIDLDNKTKSGIILPETTSKEQYFAVIVKVGNSLEGVSDRFKPDQSIIINKGTKDRAIKVILDEVEYHLIDSSSILMYEE